MENIDKLKIINVIKEEIENLRLIIKDIKRLIKNHEKYNDEEYDKVIMNYTFQLVGTVLRIKVAIRETTTYKKSEKDFFIENIYEILDNISKANDKIFHKEENVEEMLSYMASQLMRLEAYAKHEEIVYTN